MVTFETAMAAILTFGLGVASGFYFLWVGIGAFKRHAVHCSCCKAKVLSLFADHHQQAVEEVQFCPWKGWYEQQSK
jgi:hypothetical protein